MKSPFSRFFGGGEKLVSEKKSEIETEEKERKHSEEVDKNSD